MKPQMMTCPNCSGKGIVVHVKRLVGDPPKPDTTDFQSFELCPHCGGSGLVPYKDDPPS